MGDIFDPVLKTNLLMVVQGVATSEMLRVGEVTTRMVGASGDVTATIDVTGAPAGSVPVLLGMVMSGIGGAAPRGEMDISADGVAISSLLRVAGRLIAAGDTTECEHADTGDGVPARATVVVTVVVAAP